MDLVAVRFTAKVPPYNVGDVAGFPAEQAGDFIERGLAVPYDPAVTEPDSASVAALLEGSLLDVVRRLASTEDRELLIAARKTEYAGERRPTAIQAIDQRLFQLRLHVPRAEARDEAAAERHTVGRPPVVDDPGPADTEALAGTITDVADHVLGLDDVDLLQRLHRDELVGRGRAGALGAIKDRLASLGRSPGDRPRGDGEPRAAKQGGGALRRLVSGAARRLAPSKAERERRARRRRAEQEQRRQQRIIDQAVADGIEIWGINDRPSNSDPWRWRDW